MNSKVDDELEKRRNAAITSQWQEKTMLRSALYDPIEDDPQYSDIIKALRDEADNVIDRGLGLGRCHSIWGYMKKTLKERHGIIWYSPAEMNPKVCFD